MKNKKSNKSYKQKNMLSIATGCVVHKVFNTKMSYKKSI